MLGIDTSTATGSVAVGDATGILAELVLNVGAGHSSALLPAASEALRIAGLTPRDLAAIVVGGGPGSFTGLRVAAATAKGMLQALPIPLYSYSGLFAAAAAHWASRGPVWGVFDARRRDVFA
jgi:tRNA threonylcarbamoyladenosine biosynthesis protein TsaB